MNIKSVKFRKKKLPSGKKKGKKKWIVIGVGVLLVAVAAGTRLNASKDVLPAVSVEAVQKGDITSRLDTSGTVVSLNTKTYFSPVNANIETYNLKVGQSVKKGELLVSFNTDSLEEDNTKAWLTASSTVNGNKDTEEKTQKALNEASVASTNVNIIQGDIDNFKAWIDNLNTAIADRTRELTRKALQDAARPEKELTKLSQMQNLATQKEALTEQNAALQSEIDNLQIQKSQSEFEGDTATAGLLKKQIDEKEKTIGSNQKQLQKLEKKLGKYASMSAADIESQITALSSAQAGSGEQTDASTDEQIVEWQQELADAQETLAELQANLAEEEAKVSAGDSAKMTEAGKKAMESSNNLAELESASVAELLEKGRAGIRAEFDGIITGAELMPGAMATQGMELVKVADSREVAVEATVSKYDYGNLKIGQKAEIVLGNNTYQGTVSAISKVAQVNEKGSPVITCDVKFDNPDDEIFLGVEAKVSIITAEEKNVLKIPYEAVNTGKDGSFCYVAEDGVVVRKDVTTGASSAEEIEILSGLNPDELVILSLPEGIEEGMPVTMENAEVVQPEAAE